MSTRRSTGRRPGRIRAGALSSLGALLLAAAVAGQVFAQGSEPRLLIPTPGGNPGTGSAPAVLAPPTPSGSSAAIDTSPSTPPPPSPSTARLEVRMTQLEQDLRTVTGRLEDVSYEVRKLGDRLDKLASDVEYRLGQIKSGDGTAGADDTARSAAPSVAAGGGAVGTTPRVAPPADTTATTKSAALSSAPGPSASAPSPAPAATPSQTANVGGGSPRDQYARAFSAMEKRNYDEAATGFDAFLKSNPDDPLADNARYWLGETYYARGDYARAAELFLDGYEKNKSGPKAPDTLLKLGLSLEGLDKKKEACASFRELNRAFPNAPDAVKQRAAQETKRIPCS